LKALRVASLSLAFAATGAAADAVAGPKDLSDAALAAYAAKPYDKAAMMERRVTLGRNHGVAVVADFPCSDVCPAYTVRIIHYDLAPGPACAAAGGVTEKRLVPFSIAVTEKAFCIPQALAGKP